MPSGRYAPGNKAWGLCQKCGLRFLLHELVFDGYYPELRVCHGCYDDKQPQEFLIDVTDPHALWKPSPEDAPIAPVLTGYGLASSIVLNWTQAQDNYGDGRVESYAVLRAVSTDGGITFGAQATLATFPNIYYGDDQNPASISLADLVENGNPATFDNWGIQQQTLTYTDDAVVLIGAELYQYQIFVQFSNRNRSVLSNQIVLATTYYHAQDEMNVTPGFLAGTNVSEVFFSSRPYPTVNYEPMNITPNQPLATPNYFNWPPEPFNITPLITAGTNVGSLISYGNAKPEPMNVTPNGIIAGQNYLALVVYSNAVPEPMNVTPGMVGGTLQFALITYTNWPAEPMNITPNMVSGTN